MSEVTRLKLMVRIALISALPLYVVCVVLSIFIRDIEPKPFSYLVDCIKRGIIK